VVKDLASPGIDIQETVTGDYLITHLGKQYPVERAALVGSDIAYLGYLMFMQSMRGSCEEKVEYSRKAYIYHNAYEANETCLDGNETEKKPR
jgi:hypothetical protein